MKTFLKISSIIATLAAIFIFAGATSAFAQGRNSGTAVGGNQGQSRGGGGLNLAAVDESAMHSAIATALGISVADLEAALDAGQTPASLALELGVDYATVRAAMDAVHEAAIQQAVADGLITQEQANWILSHRGGQNGQQGNGSQSGLGSSSGSRMGRGAGGNGGNGGANGNGGVCPNPAP